jgi:hypothetical protein
MTSLENPDKSISSLEIVKTKIRESIEKAKNNPIAESRLSEIESINNKTVDNFIERGYHDPEDIIQEDLIEVEILKSTALAENLIEYEEMLHQISSEFGLSKQWAEDLLVHENAHANISEFVNEDWIGYGAVFIKDEEGFLSNIQPLHLSKPKITWGPKEMITKKIEVLDAPRVYENQLSEGDVLDIELNQKRLEKIKLQEENEKKRMTQIREELGMK